MDRNEIIEICKRVNNGELLSDICRSLNITTCYMDTLIKREKIKKSKLLNIYYKKETEKEIHEFEKKKREFNTIHEIEELWLKRYRGIEETYDDIIDGDDEWSDSPREDVQINLNNELLAELEDIVEKEGTDLSLYIEKIILQMLERNRKTYSHTRGRMQYIKTMIEMCGYEDHEKEIIRNMKNKDFIKYGSFSYASKFNDMDTYRINYLLNNGYTLEQAEKVSEESKNDCEILECHYSLIHSKRYKTFEDVEKFLE